MKIKGIIKNIQIINLKIKLINFKENFFFKLIIVLKLRLKKINVKFLLRIGIHR